MNTLVYHRPSSIGELSPFDEAILRVAASGPVAIVSPYVGVAYLERIIALSGRWRLISDVEQWLSSLSARARLGAWGFIREHVEHIHHFGAIHAKVVVGQGAGMIGSANLTMTGITGRAEMGILLTDPPLVVELGAWFEDIWRESSCPVVDEASAFVQWLDEQAAQSPARRARLVLSGTGKQVRARLVRLQRSIEAPAPEPPTSAPLDLNVVAKSLVAAEEVRYESLERAVEAAVELLAANERFRLREVVTLVHRGFAEATVREVYLRLIQQCANHVRSVFANSTRNHLTLANGVFSPSTRETVTAALAPFDAFLTYLIQRLAFNEARELPAETVVAAETRLREQDQVILVAELIDGTFLQLEDRPGELPRYQLSRDFEWEERFHLFARAHRTWLRRKEEAATTIARPVGEDDDLDDPDFSSEPKARPSDATLTLASMRAMAATPQRPKQEPLAADAPHTLDALQRVLLERLLAGVAIEGKTHSDLLERIRVVSGASRHSVTSSFRQDTVHSNVLRIVYAHEAEQYRLEINGGLTLEDLGHYPQTRAVYQQFLKLVPDTPASNEVSGAAP